MVYLKNRWDGSWLLQFEPKMAIFLLNQSVFDIFELNDE
jgi:hypothetical protein